MNNKKFNLSAGLVASSPSVNANDGKYIVAVKNGSPLKYSSDYGSNFSDLTGSISASAVGISGDGQYILYGISSGTLELSTNGGSSFSTVSGSPSKVWTSIVISATGQYMTAVSTSGGYYSTNYGSSFSLFDSSNFQGVNMSTNGLNQIAGKTSSTNTLLRTGNAWTSVGYYSNLPSGSSSYTFSGCAISDNDQYIIAGNDVLEDIIVSTNSGASWSTPITNRTGGVGVSADGQYMTAALYFGTIRVSSDSGSTFASVHSSTQWRKCFVSASGQYQIASSPAYNYIAVSQDYGATWTDKAYNSSSYDDIHISRAV